MKTKDVPDEKVFWLNDGRVLKNLKELKEALRNMEDHVFFHHVNKERNDFYNWIKEVVKDSKLAKGIQRVKTKAGMLQKFGGAPVKKKAVKKKK